MTDKKLIKELKAAGFKFKTVTRLHRSCGPNDFKVRETLITEEVIITDR
jgi:hypothetical protein